MGSGGDSADPRVQFWLTRTFVLRPSIRCLLSAVCCLGGGGVGSDGEGDPLPVGALVEGGGGLGSLGGPHLPGSSLRRGELPTPIPSLRFW